ncbi:hypothetical protein AALP_AA2G006300 [Arabis alpina]|uniref:MBD domain-containing protein n=1 Tax=Arabis alpina TaxID=50452 RepID=A0A087HEG7_ARAAL|nr:hypothetical protein AALP_AA2G006300 [Arabis alpina]
MSRHLPNTITADTTPDWLPSGWISQSTSLKRGRQTKTYTNVITKKKLYTKDQVLEYIKMEKIREKRLSAIERTKANVQAVEDSVDSSTARERPSWLPDGWKMETRIGRYGGNQYTIYVNMSSGFKTSLKHKVLEYEDTMESEASLENVEETGIDYISEDVQDSVDTRAKPSWLPDGWKTEMRIGRFGGNQYMMYENISTGFKTISKLKVLEYQNTMESESESEASMEKVDETGNDYISEDVQDSVAARARPSWLPDGWKTELRIGRFGGNQYTMYENISSGFKTNSKRKVLEYQNTMGSESEASLEKVEETMESESEASLEKVEQTGNDYITYDYDMDEEDWSENENVEDKGSGENVEKFSYVTSTSLRSQPERMQKLDSRAKTQCVFEDEDMSSDSDIKLPDAEASKEEGGNEANDMEEARVVSHVVESEENLHNVAVECAGKAREIPGLTGSFSFEINMECEPASGNLVEKDWNKSGTEEGMETRNIEIRDQDSGLMHISASSKVEDKSEEPLKAQAAQEETANESSRSIFFPYREAPSHSVLVFENSNARSSPEDHIDTFGLGLDPQEKNISGSKKQKNTETCSPKDIKKKDTKAPTKKLRKGKKRSPSVGVDEKPIEWPEPCPYFPFEPLTRSSQVEDDSVIRMYLEQHYTAAGSGDSNLPLPDFGLPSFSNIRISEPESKKNNSPDPSCVPVPSSSLPTYNSMDTTTMQHTVAGK